MFILRRGDSARLFPEFRSITDNYIQNNEYDKLKKIGAGCNLGGGSVRI